MTREQNRGVICLLSGDRAGDGGQCWDLLVPYVFPPPQPSAKTTPSISSSHSTEVWGGTRLLWSPLREETASSQECSLHQDQARWHHGQPAHRHSRLPSRPPRLAGEISPGYASDGGQGNREQGGKENSVELVPGTYGRDRSSPRTEKDTCRHSRRPGPGRCLHFCKAGSSTRCCLGDRVGGLRR